MKFYSTRNKESMVSLSEAVLRGLAADGGLYVPASKFNNRNKLLDPCSLKDTANELLTPFCLEDFTKEEIAEMINEAFNFPLPVIELQKKLFVCELYHGPTLAFKDFGGRFIAQLMSKCIQKKSDKLIILVATSGDTGSAVASGFYNVPNIEVIILYPAGKVSALQEKQLTTYGGNITAIKVNGTFDTCQQLVKQAFGDRDLNSQVCLSSANSINIGRLLPQMVYYGVVARQMHDATGKKPTMMVPSGNFGNLMAGLMALKMGEPIKHFVAVVNANKVVPDYLSSGNYTPTASVQTLSNAMDVGAPSNMERIQWLYNNNVQAMAADFSSISISDSETLQAMKQTYSDFGYVADPHTSVAIAAYKKVALQGPVVIMSTAHPAKFKETVEQALDINIELPSQLQAIVIKQSHALQMDAEYASLKKIILENQK